MAVFLALAALASWPATTLADGDPASDVLLLQDLYAPYQPPLSAPVAGALTGVLKQTRAAGYQLKVAIVDSPNDLGAVPNLFGQPQRYAAFLASEISFNNKRPLLVVMPAGYGLANANAASATAIRGLAPPTSGGSDSLGRAAIEAAVRLARAGGHPVATPKVAGGSSSSGTSPAIVFGAPVALLLIAGALATLRRRSAGPHEQPQRR